MPVDGKAVGTGNASAAAHACCRGSVNVRRRSVHETGRSVRATWFIAGLWEIDA